MLQRTSQTASRAPVGQRDEVLRMEHVGALADSLTNAAPPAATIEAGAPLPHGWPRKPSSRWRTPSSSSASWASGGPERQEGRP
jgi:hypothetical protein